MSRQPFKLPPTPTSETAEEKKNREKHEANVGLRAHAAITITATMLQHSTSSERWGSSWFRWNFPSCLMERWSGCSGLRPLLRLTTSLCSGRDRLLTEQGVEDWPNQFRTARFYPAVEYIQANRARTLAVQQVSALFEKVDIIVASSGGAQLLATNLTGHPALIVPNGLRGDDAPKPPKIDDGEDDDIGGPGTPVSITFLAGLYEDAKLAAFRACISTSDRIQ